MAVQLLKRFRQEFGIGRIYRVLGKFLNLTGERIVSLDVQVGTGVGDEFVPLLFDQDGVAFELRQLVDREFFEGETGAPDISVWDPQRFAAMAPKLFDDGARPRFDPGFFSDASAGLIPPQMTEPSDQSQFIDSGTVIQDGIVGAMTPNHFDIPNNQGFGAVPPLVGNVFGYLLPDIKAPFVIARHDDGNPESESDALVAWWDGFNYRYGLAGDPDLGVGPYGIVPGSQLQQWAALPLGLEPDADEDPARFEFLLSDDHANVNMDVYLHISENILDSIDGEGQPKFENITLRLTANSVASLGLGEIGERRPLVARARQRGAAISDFVPVTGVPVAINDLAVTLEDERSTWTYSPMTCLTARWWTRPWPRSQYREFPGQRNRRGSPGQQDDRLHTGGRLYRRRYVYLYGHDRDRGVKRRHGQGHRQSVAHPGRPGCRQRLGGHVRVHAGHHRRPGQRHAFRRPDSRRGSTGSRRPACQRYRPRQPWSATASFTIRKDTPPETIDVFTYQVTVEGVPSNTALVIVRVDEDADLIFADGFE